MPRRKEQVKQKLVLNVPVWVVDELDSHAAAVGTSRNKAGGELLIHSLVANRRNIARAAATQLAVKQNLWTTWCRLRRWHWSFYHLHREVGHPLGEAIRSLSRNQENDKVKELWVRYETTVQSLQANMSVRVRYLLGLLARWAGTGTAPEQVRNKDGKMFPCRAVAEKELSQLGEQRNLPKEEAD